MRPRGNEANNAAQAIFPAILRRLDKKWRFPREPRRDAMGVEGEKG